MLVMEWFAFYPKSVYVLHIRHISFTLEAEQRSNESNTFLFDSYNDEYTILMKCIVYCIFVLENFISY